MAREEWWLGRCGGKGRVVSREEWWLGRGGC